MTGLPRYDRRQSYDWNYEQAPDIESIGNAAGSSQIVPGDWKFCGRSVASPLGISAGPLLNGRWVLFYAALGFDVLTYKTVRSQLRACYPLPNLTPVATAGPIEGSDQLAAADAMGESWAISFGMPSKAPECWQDDVTWTRQKLPAEKVLSVSVVATPSPEWTIDQVAADYARCARWAVDSGADAIELNFSCPNVSSCDGQLYQQANHAAEVASHVRDKIPGVPLIVKIGYLPHTEQAAILLEALAACIDALSMVNCLAARVSKDGQALFGNEPRGIGGRAIYEQCLAQVRIFAECTTRMAKPPEIIGVGGIATARDVCAYLNAGATAIQMATAPMLNPLVAQQIKRSLATE